MTWIGENNRDVVIAQWAVGVPMWCLADQPQDGDFKERQLYSSRVLTAEQLRFNGRDWESVCLSLADKAQRHLKEFALDPDLTVGALFSNFADFLGHHGRYR